MIDDDDFIDDEDDAPRDAKAHAGVLSVPGAAKSEAEFQAAAAGFRSDAFPLLIVDHDPEKNEIWIAPSSIAELRAAGWRGTTIAEAEDFLRPVPGRSRRKGTGYDGPSQRS